jgi:hypothetical protein
MMVSKDLTIQWYSTHRANPAYTMSVPPNIPMNTPQHTRTQHTQHTRGAAPIRTAPVSPSRKWTFLLETARQTDPFGAKLTQFTYLGERQGVGGGGRQGVARGYTACCTRHSICQTRLRRRISLTLPPLSPLSRSLGLPSYSLRSLLPLSSTLSSSSSSSSSVFFCPTQVRTPRTTLCPTSTGC